MAVGVPSRLEGADKFGILKFNTIVQQSEDSESEVYTTMDSDDSWEPEPCNSRDLTYEDKTKEFDIDIDSFDVVKDSQHARPHSEQEARMLCGLEGSSLYRLPINSGSEITKDDIRTFKRPKQGMHGNQASTSTDRLSFIVTNFLPQDPRKAREAQSQKWSSEGRGQVLISREVNCCDLK